MSDEWLNEAMEVAVTVSRQVHRKYHVYFDAADVQQELVEWAMKRQHKVKEWLDPDLDSLERKANIRQLAKSMNREAERYCRSRKARSCGYETRDEAFYSAGMLEELIAHLDEIENMTTQSSGNVRVSNGGSDPATANNYLASVIDVRNAMEQLDPVDNMMLTMKYQENMTLQQIADMMDVSDSTVSRRIHQALRRMVTLLGGESPWGGSGSRRVVSNQQAQAAVQDV